MYSIDDLDLDDPEIMKVCLSNWYAIESIAERHIKALDLLIEMQDRWENSGLSVRQKKVLASIFINNDQKKEASRDLKLSAKQINTSIEDGLNLLSRRS